MRIELKDSPVIFNIVFVLVDVILERENAPTASFYSPVTNEQKGIMLKG